MSKTRIMIVEDEAIVAEGIKINLESMGFEVTSTVKTGDAAIENTEKDRPDVILMDILLEGQSSGIEAAELIRSRFDIPVIFLTAFADDDKLERAKLTQPFGYVLKPFRDRDLKITIEMALYVSQMDAERRRIEAALKESEELHRIILSSISDAVFITDDRGVFTFICPNVEVIFGGSLKEVEEFGNIEKLFGNRLFDFKELEISGEIQNIEWEIKDKAGEKHFLLVNVKRVSIKGGTVLYTCHDITHRKQLQDMIVKSERELRIRDRINNIFLTCPDENMYGEVLKVVLEVLESEFGTFGYIAEDGSFVAPALTREAYWDKCKVPEKEIVFQKGIFEGIWGRAIRERKTFISNEGPFNTPDGHIPIENTMVTPIIFQDKVISAVHLANKSNGYDEEDRRVMESIAEKIAPVLYARLQRDNQEKERKEAEEALQKTHDELEQRVAQRTKELMTTKDQYQRLVEGTPGILYLFSDKRGGVYYSPQVESVLGNTVSHLKENPMIWHDSIHPDDIDKVDRAIEDFVSGKDYDLEYRIHDASAEWHWFRDRSIGRRKENDEIIIEGLAIDFTEQKRAKEEKEKLESQLQQAQKMEAIGTLAGGIAHDFNNILAAIIGHGEIMELFEIPEGHEMRSSLKEVLNAAYRAQDLVEQILTFSRQGQQEKKAIRLTPIIRESLRLLRASLPSTIEIQQNLENLAGTVIADPSQIHQVLMNLCTNAGHAMRDEGGVLEVRLTAVNVGAEDVQLMADLEPGPYIRLDIRDTGHGMAPDIMGRIFDPYYTTKGNGEGTGLGLSVVHGIVKNHQGAITVESQLGVGSTFQVFLPLKETKSVEQEVEQLEPLPIGKGCILFVDDEKSLVNFGEEILEHLGYEAVVRTSSVEALEAFTAQPDRFDLVITDMTMPNMTGLELSEAIIRTRPDLPIILCTGFSEAITAESAKAAGIKEFVQKPIGVHKFAETIKRVLGEND